MLVLVVRELNVSDVQHTGWELVFVAGEGDALLKVVSLDSATTPTSRYLHLVLHERSPTLKSDDLHVRGDLQWALCQQQTSELGVVV